MRSKVFTAALLPMCFVGIILRIIEIIRGIDASTGFYAIGSSWYKVFNAVSIIFSVLLFMAIFLVKKEKKSLCRIYMRVSMSERIWLMIVSALILASTFTELFIKFAKYGFSTLPSNDILFEILIIITSILSAAFFIAYASGPRIFGKSEKFKLLSLSVTFYYIIRLLQTFLDDAITSHAYKTYAVLFAGCVILFFLNFSKAISGLSARKYLVAFGCLTGYFGSIRLVDCIFSIIPRYNLPDNFMIYLCDVAVTVAVVFLTMKCTRQRRKTKPEPEQVQEPVVQNCD